MNRTVGTLLGHEVTKKWGGAGLPDNTIDITLTGSAGQSFGAFVPAGIQMRLVGDANDYLGKGLSGGRLIVHPHPFSTFVAEEQIVMPATSSPTARRAARSSCAAASVNGSAFATPVRPRSAKASATTGAST